MATHIYVAGGTVIVAEPPQGRAARLWHTTLAHAVEVAISTYAMVAGTLMTLTAGMIGERLPVPVILVYGLGAFLGVGGFLALCGIYIRRRNLRIELNTEQAGWVLQAIGWLTFMYVGWRVGNPANALVAGTIIGTGSVLRTIALIKLERRLTDAVTEEVTDPTPEEEPDDDLP